jgi:alpha-glucoside transport system substrate-binding protein
MGLGEYNGKHYGVPTNVNLKSMIWYPKKAFDAAGYQVPKTWDDLLALSQQIQDDGSTPWCVGFESGGATGWPATDWMEDIMLRTAGVDTYDKWVTHDIPFNDPSVVKAGQLFGDIMFHDGWVLGGAAQTPSIAFGDAPTPMFDNPPKCWLHRQANFIVAFFPSTAVAGTDYDFFPFPTIDDPSQSAALIGGELSVVFRNAPEVKDFIEKFAGEQVQCDQGASTATSHLAERERRAELLREPDPRLGVRGDDGGDPERQRPIRRLRRHALRGGVGELLDGHGEVHAGRSGLAPGRARRHREELADELGHTGTRARP